MIRETSNASYSGSDQGGRGAGWWVKAARHRRRPCRWMHRQAPNTLLGGRRQNRAIDRSQRRQRGGHRQRAKHPTIRSMGRTMVTGRRVLAWRFAVDHTLSKVAGITVGRHAGAERDLRHQRKPRECFQHEVPRSSKLATHTLIIPLRHHAGRGGRTYIVYSARFAFRQVRLGFLRWSASGTETPILRLRHGWPVDQNSAFSSPSSKRTGCHGCWPVRFAVEWLHSAAGAGGFDDEAVRH